MKKLFSIFLLIGLLSACDKDDARIDNPNLFDINENFTINLSLPQYSPLQFPSNPVFIAGHGNGGIVIMNTGTDSYVAYDAADPNHPKQDNCNSMQIDNLHLVCSCEDNTYDLYTGNFVEGDNLKYTLYPYRITENNGILQITN